MSVSADIPDIKDELLAITASLRAHLEAEHDLGAAGLAISQAPQRLVAPQAASPASRSIGPQRNDSARPSMPTPLLSPAAIEPARPAVVLPLAERQQRLAVLAEQASTCTRCVLHEKRKQTVFARGAADAELAFVGEGPGRDEDAQGLPFVGAAGQLLDKMIAAMGYGRDDVYICNVVKCRPPENRTPRPEEALACSQFLVPQLELIAPKAIVALGKCAAQALGVAEPTGPWRGKWGSWRGVPILPTYHPAFLLRSPEFKRTVWEDLQLVMGRLGRSPAPRG
jgi:uracil-DNA glycosylase family 4